MPAAIPPLLADLVLGVEGSTLAWITETFAVAP